MPFCAHMMPIVLIFVHVARALRKQWRKRGWNSIAYDVKLDTHHDVVSRDGFFLLMRYSLECHDRCGDMLWFDGIFRETFGMYTSDYMCIQYTVQIQTMNFDEIFWNVYKMGSPRGTDVWMLERW